MSSRKAVFPFTAIVGQERMKKALVLNAINPNLGGVLIRGQKGTAKSTAARALSGLLPEIEVVEDCLFNCNPRQKNQMCRGCLERQAGGVELPVARRKIKVVDLPLGATEDRLLGTLNIEQAIKKGEKVFEPGILASAHRGILYVDEVNLLDDHLVDVLLDSAAMGVNTVEREGVSFSHPARFILVGTMNPEEGELRPQLLDRFGLCVEVEGIADTEERIKVVERYTRYENDPHDFEASWSAEESSLAQLIVRAEELFPGVGYSKDILRLIAGIAAEMNVDGHRADIFMLKTARTIAAYHERTQVTDNDVKEAAELVLSHRMRRNPFQEQGIDKEKLEESIQKHRKQSEKETGGEHKASAGHDPQERKESPAAGRPEVVFEAEGPRQMKRILLPRESTIKSGSGRRSKARSETKSGRYVGSGLPEDKTDDIAFDATLRACAPHQIHRRKNGLAVAIEPRDIRRKVREKKIGNTIVFVVDSSGSMGVNRRMVETKGAILSLLVDAYQKRDKVGLVAFRGDKAELLLAPTASIELARKRLEDLPTGGKTPLSKGLLKGFEVLRGELKKDKKIKPLLVVISDGKANSGVRGNTGPFNEAVSIAGEIKHSGIKSIAIDTETGLVRLGRLRELSASLGGRYFPLEEISAGVITGLVRKTIEGNQV